MQLAIEDALVEQRNMYGEVTSRIQVKAANRHEFRFSIDGYESASQPSVAGTGKVRNNSIHVSFKDNETGTELLLDMDADQSIPGLVHNTVSLDGKLYGFDLDLKKGKETLEEMQKLLKQGKKEEAFRMKPKVTATLSPKQEYLAFFRDVANSSASYSFGKAARLMMLGHEETNRNSALAILRSAVFVLIPLALNPPVGREPVDTVAEPKSKIAAVSYKPRALPVPGSFINAPQTGVHVSCGFCDAVVLGGGTVGCLALGLYGCDPSWPDWLCLSLTLACIGGAVYLFVICEHNCD